MSIDVLIFEETWLNLHEITYMQTILEERRGYSYIKLLSADSNANFQTVKLILSPTGGAITSEIISLARTSVWDSQTFLQVYNW